MLKYLAWIGQVRIIGTYYVALSKQCRSFLMWLVNWRKCTTGYKQFASVTKQYSEIFCCCIYYDFQINWENLGSNQIDFEQTKFPIRLHQNNLYWHHTYKQNAFDDIFSILTFQIFLRICFTLICSFHLLRLLAKSK